MTVCMIVMLLGVELCRPGVCKKTSSGQWDTCMQKSSVTVHLGEFDFCDAFFMFKYLDFVQLPLDWGECQILWKEKLILIIQTSVTSTLSLVGFASNLLVMYTQGKRRKNSKYRRRTWQIRIKKYPVCKMLSSRWHFLLLLLQVLPSTCDYESWNRQRELDKKREMVSQGTLFFFLFQITVRRANLFR